ncbi:MAG: hypothetical protein FWD48_09460 [Oscillospiraceae bacterium]|nr:hypothetical protein [Oscillospiraceae bacterium]
MKKKILSAVLAIVICFSAFSFVAVADEAAAGAKTKAELQELMSGFPSAWRDGALWENGDASAERFEKAFDVAEKIAGDGEASPEEITVAWVLLDAAFEGLVKKSMADLNALIAEVKNTYQRNNVFNNANENDLIFSMETFDRFMMAYDNADDHSDADDTNKITNLYLELECAFNCLDRLQVVTRNELRNLDRTVERLAEGRDKFTPERRGRAGIPQSWGTENASEFTFHNNNWSSSGGGNPIFWDLLWNAAILNTLTTGDNNPYRSGDWSAFFPYDIVAPVFQAQKEIFDDLGVGSTTDEDVVGAYNRALRTTAMINSFAADGTGRGSERTITNLMNNNADLIVRNENRRGATDASLAMVTGNTGSNGSMRALYNAIDALPAGKWITARGNTNVMALEDKVTVRVNDAGRIIGLGSINPAAGTALEIGGNTNAVDLVKRVAIDTVTAPQAFIIGQADLNALHNGRVAAFQPALGNAWRYAQTLAAVDRPAGFALVEPNDDLILATRLLTYAINDAKLSDNMETRDRLSNLIDSSEAIDDITTKFFSASGTDHYGDVRGARSAANQALRDNPVANRANNNDSVANRNFFPAYKGLNDAVTDFNNAINRDWPVAIDEGENSVFFVIMASMASTDEKVAELRTALALALLDEDGCGGGDCKGDEYLHGDFPIFDNASFVASARLWNGRDWECAFASYTAYAALAQSLGLVAGGSTYAKGDVNGDGAVTTADALEILRYVAGLDNAITGNAQALVAGSITADAPTTACALQILRLVAGLIDAL